MVSVQHLFFVQFVLDDGLLQRAERDLEGREFAQALEGRLLVEDVAAAWPAQRSAGV